MNEDFLAGARAERERILVKIFNVMNSHKETLKHTQDPDKKNFLTIYKNALRDTIVRIQALHLAGVKPVPQDPKQTRYEAFRSSWTKDKLIQNEAAIREALEKQNV
jgi:hypothetical protein